MKRILIVDDEPIKLCRNYGNAIYIKAFAGQREDSELELLAKYLHSLSKHEDMRQIEKRDWRWKTTKSL